MSDRQDNGRDESPDDHDGLSLLQMIGSALAAAFGVQSSRNRERDFSRGKPIHFIIIGVVLTILFVLSVAGVVSLVLRNVG
jgi:hypothetical protein